MKGPEETPGETNGRATYRALRAVLHVVHGQLHLRLLRDVGVLEEGDAAEEDGVAGALWAEHRVMTRAVSVTPSPV